MNNKNYVCCSVCGGLISSKDKILKGDDSIELKFYLNMFKANNNLKNDYLKFVTNELEKRFKEYTSGEDESFKSFIRNDHNVCLNVLKIAFEKGYTSTSTNAFYSAETSVRDLIFIYFCKFIASENVKIYCSKGCGSFNLETIYNNTDKRLGEEGVKKLIDRIKAIESYGISLNGLVSHNGNPVSVIFGKRPYHLIFNYENRILNVTPYCIWFEVLSDDSVNVDTIYIYNNLRNRHKGSLVTMKDAGNRHLDNYIGIDLAYKFYNGRISIEKLLNIKK